MRPGTPGCLHLRGSPGQAGQGGDGGDPAAVSRPRCRGRPAGAGVQPAVPYHIAEEIRLAEVAEVEEAGAGGGEEPLGGEGLQDTVHGARAAGARPPPALGRRGSVRPHAPARPPAAAAHGRPRSGAEPSERRCRSGRLSVPRCRGPAGGPGTPPPLSGSRRGGTFRADTPKAAPPPPGQPPHRRAGRARGCPRLPCSSRRCAGTRGRCWSPAEPGAFDERSKPSCQQPAGRLRWLLCIPRGAAPGKMRIPRGRSLKGSRQGGLRAPASRSGLAGRPGCSSTCGCSVIKELGTIKELQEDYMVSDKWDYGSLSPLIITPPTLRKTTYNNPVEEALMF